LSTAGSSSAWSPIAGAEKVVRNDEVVATLKAICAHPAKRETAAA
jgi:hypothetical protein